MIEYKIEMEEIQVAKNITCDVCKTKYDYEKDDMEIQEFHHINFVGGFSSVFGDMNRVRGDICQHCLNKKLGEDLIIGDPE